MSFQVRGAPVPTRPLVMFVEHVVHVQSEFHWHFGEIAAVANERIALALASMERGH